MALIFLTRQIPSPCVDALSAAGHEVTVGAVDRTLSAEELRTAVAAKPYEVLITLLTDTVDASIFAVAPHLKVVANYAVGYNNIDLSAAMERNIVVTNTPGVLTDTVAEFTMALILAVTKRITEADRYTRAGAFTGWEPELLLGCDLHGKTLLIVGGGRIGTAVARAAHHGLGMQIVYTDQALCDPLEACVPATYFASLDEALPLADVVSLHVPLLPTTTHLMNADRLALMKPTAYLVNTARGPIVDEAALAQALATDIIAGAALDVFEREPVVHPGLLGSDKVVLTPHIASASIETRTKMSEIVAENVLAVLAGGVAPNQVRA